MAAAIQEVPSQNAERVGSESRCPFSFSVEISYMVPAPLSPPLWSPPGLLGTEAEMIRSAFAVCPLSSGSSPETLVPYISLYRSDVRESTGVALTHPPQLLAGPWLRK